VMSRRKYMMPIYYKSIVPHEYKYSMLILV
jgi:hypothetical protein